MMSTTKNYLLKREKLKTARFNALISYLKFTSELQKLKDSYSPNNQDNHE